MFWRFFYAYPLFEQFYYTYGMGYGEFWKSTSKPPNPNSLWMLPNLSEISCDDRARAIKAEIEYVIIYVIIGSWIQLAKSNVSTLLSIMSKMPYFKNLDSFSSNKLGFLVAEICKKLFHQNMAKMRYFDAFVLCLVCAWHKWTESMIFHISENWFCSTLKQKNSFNCNIF